MRNQTNWHAFAKQDLAACGNIAPLFLEINQINQISRSTRSIMAAGPGQAPASDAFGVTIHDDNENIPPAAQHR